VGLFNENIESEFKGKLPLSRHFDPRHNRYDAIIIGAGMSGMAAAIRLAMYDKKVLLLEKHTISGGLNSYYNRRERKLDVGLHALTNFAAKKERGKPLTKLLKQLRIPYEKLELTPQFESRIDFPETNLRFSNDLNLLIDEINQKFPHESDGFHKLLAHIEAFNEVALDNKTVMAKDVVKDFIKDPLLLEMIFCPLLIYGSAWENDMDFSQFVIMFKSIYLEGFARSRGGVRRVLELLRERLEEVEAEVCYRNGVEKILTKDDHAYGVITTRGQEIHAPLILSCAGLPETLSMATNQEFIQRKPSVGKLSFTETIFTLDKRPAAYALKDTIIFYNNQNHYEYRQPQSLYDNKSAVVCLPNNFLQDDYSEGVYRLTMMANYQMWRDLLGGADIDIKKASKNNPAYLAAKEEVLKESLTIMKKFMPELDTSSLTFSDVFTPTTVERYTGHLGGCVYGSPDKSRDGTTPYKGLFVCGTDQGFLGIIGSMLSGISMANLHGFMNPQASIETPVNTNKELEAPTSPL
jgi:phytoene dehydrogenase-like protein